MDGASRRGRAGRWLIDRVETPYAGAVVVIGIGFVLFGSYLAFLRANASYHEGPAWLFLVGLGLMLFLSATLVAAAVRLLRADGSADALARVAMWSLGGLVASLSLTFWPIFYQRLVGVGVEDPGFILLVSATVGANAGVVAGRYRVESLRQRSQLRRARDAFRFLNRMLRHNVLNSVNIIDGYATQLRENPRASQSKVVRTIVAQCRQITALIRNARVLVDRLEDDHPRSLIDFTAAVERELDVARETYGTATFAADLEPGVTVPADELLAAAVRNLLSNAVEHNDREAPVVRVTLECDDDVARLRVADDGPGIPDDRKAEAFDPGEHGDSGLGLYLTRRLVTDYGGTVRLADNDPRGTVAVVELPAADADS